MNRTYYLLAIAAVVGGVIGGVLMSQFRDNGPVISTDAKIINPAANSPANSALLQFPLSEKQGQVDESIDVQALIQEIRRLDQRIAALETSALPQVSDSVTADLDAEVATEVQARGTSETLILAGLDPSVADAIEQRQHQRSLADLELRDKAAREGYLRTDRFRRERRESLPERVSIRDETSDEIYDQYLYLKGDPNRVEISSVMTGSVAGDAGIQEGDQIYSYDGSRIFNSRDVRRQILAGDKDETVSVAVVRDGSKIWFSVPRGPLGVMMRPKQEDPKPGPG